jgi:cell division protein FtsB
MHGCTPQPAARAVHAAPLPIPAHIEPAMSASPTPESQVEPRTSARPLLILLIAICTMLVVTYAARLGSRDDMQQEIVEQQLLNEQAKVRTAELQRELVEVKKPSYIDEAARGHLDLGKEGDIVIVAVAAGQSSAVEDAPPAAVPASWQPVWRQWLTLFTPNS